MANEEFKNMTLQEKLLNVRSMIKPLIKKQHSEEVNYEFSKIDDIYDDLTPALNTVRINFDILREEATKKDENGYPVYFTLMPKADMAFWIYEADVDIRWTNVDAQDDVIDFTLHVIGSHPDAVEKAKGSGMTYCLKNYLIHKFSIIQKSEHSGEDSDMNTYSVDDSGNSMTQGSLSGNSTAPNGKQTNSNIPPVSQAIMPQNGQSVQLPQNAKPNQGNHSASPAKANDQKENMSVSEAENTVCSFGPNKGKTLAQIIKAGDIDSIHWIANAYRGNNEEVKRAAKILLNASEMEDGYLKASGM